MEGGNQNEEELLNHNRKLKKAVLDVMFQHCDTFYIHCMPDPELQIGTRGLVERETEEGIVLVFGPYSTRHLSWDDQFLFCELQFSRWEQVRIPYECVGRVFDKGGQVIMQWATMTAERLKLAKTEDESGPRSASKKVAPRSSEKQSAKSDKSATQAKSGKKADESRVIEVDFRNRRKD
ncbi:MAG: ClpXP protease specificity-enhancing factor SspB [bacterium]|nr:ClpXP protease specificity-enhancing factor SspB [bacterium]